MAEFTVLGITESEERTWRFVLARPGATEAAIATGIGLRRPALRSALRTLEDRALIQRAPTEPATFSAGSPDATLEPLIIAQQEELERVRGAMRALTDQLREGDPDGDGLIEIVTGPRARRRAFIELQHAAKHEVKIFDKPPYSSGGNKPPPNQIERARLPEGLRYRVIYDPAGLSAERIAAASDVIAMGEEARILDRVPIKLTIADDDLALIGPAAGSMSAVLARGSALVESFVILFDLLWERALPFRGSTSPTAFPRELDERSKRILLLMSVGMKDEAIARELGVVRRTVERHLTKIMRELGVRTRFQAGLEAERRGWLST